MCTPKNLVLLTFSTIDPPEGNNILLGFVYIKENIVVTALLCQMFHPIPTLCLVIVVDETHHSCIICKIDKGVESTCQFAFNRVAPKPKTLHLCEAELKFLTHGFRHIKCVLDTG